MIDAKQILSHYVYQPGLIAYYNIINKALSCLDEAFSPSSSLHVRSFPVVSGFGKSGDRVEEGTEEGQSG